MTTNNEVPMPEAGQKVVLAQVHVTDGVYNYHYKYNTPTEIMMTIAMLEKLKLELLEHAFPKQEPQEDEPAPPAPPTA